MLEPLRARLEDALDFAPLCGLLKKTPDGRLMHAPFALFPCPIDPASDAALRALTAPFNRLALAVSNDLDFLSEALAVAAGSDPFIERLLAIARAAGRRQPLQLQLIRSDYFLQPSGPGPLPQIRQVELNTIAASYLGLAGRVNRLHRHLLRDTAWSDALIANDPIPGVVEGVAEALRRYGVPGACVAMVVQPGEANVFDQRLLQMALSEAGVASRRVTLQQIGRQGRLKEGHLVLDGQVIAMAYFRAGYGPEDYAEPSAWQGRELVENSSAIAVPTVATQLAGTKKVQQLLATPQILRKFAADSDAARMEAAFAGIFALEQPVESENGSQPAWRAALAEPGGFVLKPQREGGGHNLYGEEMVQRLNALKPAQRGAYILMERIRPFLHPVGLVADGTLSEGVGVSEIGRFGLLLAQGDELLRNDDLGYLVRTKGSEVREGGVSAGFGFLGSLLAMTPEQAYGTIPPNFPHPAAP